MKQINISDRHFHSITSDELFHILNLHQRAFKSKHDPEPDYIFGDVFIHKGFKVLGWGDDPHDILEVRCKYHCIPINDFGENPLGKIKEIHFDFMNYRTCYVIMDEDGDHLDYKFRPFGINVINYLIERGFDVELGSYKESKDHGQQ